MRRALGVLCVVLVLGGWTSCQPVTGGEPMAGPTTTGLAALIAGEDWHYVGETGEPAFENSWANVSGGAALAFRIRESGVVDVQGVIAGGVAQQVFTLPSGYRPSNTTQIPITTYDLSTQNFHAALLYVQDNGAVLVIRQVDGVVVTGEDSYLMGQVFLDSPALAP